MVNAIPIIGWIVSILAFAFISIPFWLIWTYCGIGEKFFSFLPWQWLSITYPECVGVFMCIYIIRSVLLPSMNIGVENKSK